MKKTSKGFTLIEVLVVIGIIAILAAIVIVSINPAKRFQDANNAQRQANVESILSAVQQNMIDNKGVTTCSIPGTATDIASGGSADLASCLSNYLATLPVDPIGGSWTSASNYDTKYNISMDSTTKQVTVNAPNAEGGVTISMTR